MNQDFKRGHLSEHFRWFGWKVLSEVEINPVRSNQHEFAAGKFKPFLGGTKQHFDSSFIYLGDTEEETCIDSGLLTYYDAREHVDHRTSEWRFYYTTNNVVEAAIAGDLLIVGQKVDNTIQVVIVKDGSTAENQIQWLFGIADSQQKPMFSMRKVDEQHDKELHFSERLILEHLGFETIASEPSFLDDLVESFGSSFPTTKEFSSYARSTLPEVKSIDGSDKALMAWLEREEVLFRTLEKHIVAERLKTGFGDDVDAFITYSLSVQNRRKSRAGYAFENHLEQIFKEHSIGFARGQITEKKNKPDFIFPNIESYHNKVFPETLLSMLGCKSSCKERWRQILPEADRIDEKHLITLEPSISEDQTNEMQSHKVQLVVPYDLFESYKPLQRSWLMDVQSFIDIVASRQKTAVDSGVLVP